MRISDWSSDVCSSDLTLDISLTKIAGLWLTWAGIAIDYATFRFYWADGFAFAMWCLQLAAPFVFVLSIPYVLWLDRRLVDPKDGAYALGAWLMGTEQSGRASCRERGCQYVEISVVGASRK